MNPILQQLNAVIKPQNNIQSIMSLIRNRDPENVFNQMMQTNPQFKRFVEQNKNKTAEQIAKENGIDINLLQQFMIKK